MTIHEALLIREIKKRTTYRRLAEVYYPVDHDGHGNQGYGEDLCREALDIIYPNRDIWRSKDKDQSAQFGLDNKSYIGEFYWWE